MNIVVLGGGISTERDVSLTSSRNIVKALRSVGENAVLLDVFMGYDGDPEEFFSKNEEVTSESLIGLVDPSIDEIKKARGISEDEFFGKKTELVLLDKPMPVTEMYVDEHNTWKRSAIIREQVLEAAEYRCEIDPTHKSFVVEHTNHQYAEGHHVIALNKQDRIPYSLDVYANIICLCPVCHRLLHYGSPHEKKPVAKIIYDKRANRLAKSGIKLSQREFENLVL